MLRSYMANVGLNCTEQRNEDSTAGLAFFKI